MTQQLPTELNIHIIQHVDRTFLPVILRVNSTFHEIGEPILYHTVVLRPFPRERQMLGTATRCLKTINERSAAAGAVHRMGVDLFDWSPYTSHTESDFGAEDFFEAFRTALPKAVNLQKLDISGWGNTAVNNVSQLPRGCRFSALRHYMGPPEILENIQSNVLRTLFLYSLGNKVSTLSGALSTAARFSGQTLRALNVRCEVADHDPETEEWEGLYKDIPLLFPNLRHLTLESGNTISFALLDKLIPDIKPLPELRLLRIYSWEGIGLEEEESRVKHLHAGCPQLRAISLGRPWRYCEGVSRWLPPSNDEPSSDDQLWKEADYRKYLEDPDHEGFVYRSLLYEGRKS